MMRWGLILLTVFASSCGDILCAKGMSQGGELGDFGPSGVMRVVRYIITRRTVILGGLCYATAFFSLLGLLSVAQLSVAVPATALSFVVDTIGARFILGEHVPWKRWVGVMFVTAGVVLTVSAGPAPGTRGAPGASQASSVPPSRSHSRAILQGSVLPPPEPSPAP